MGVRASWFPKLLADSQISQPGNPPDLVCTSRYGGMDAHRFWRTPRFIDMEIRRMPMFFPLIYTLKSLPIKTLYKHQLLQWYLLYTVNDDNYRAIFLHYPSPAHTFTIQSFQSTSNWRLMFACQYQDHHVAWHHLSSSCTDVHRSLWQSWKHAKNFPIFLTSLLCARSLHTHGTQLLISQHVYSTRRDW